MELSMTLESLHRHLGLLVELLQEEQEALLYPSQETEAVERLHHLDQEKLRHFQSIEQLEGECDEYRQALSAAAQDTPTPDDGLVLWRQVLDLTDHAARLHQLNSTLIRHGLVHHQCVLNNLRRLGSTLSSPEPTQEQPKLAAAKRAVATKPVRKTRTRSKKVTEPVGQEH